MEATPFNQGSTQVVVRPNVTVMLLHGNEIAYRYNDPERTISITNRGWFSTTTKDRLNAIEGVNVAQRSKTWYLNGKGWDGKLIDVKL